MIVFEEGKDIALGRALKTFIKALLTIDAETSMAATERAFRQMLPLHREARLLLNNGLEIDAFLYAIVVRQWASTLFSENHRV
jgi:hypothetical protein